VARSTWTCLVFLHWWGATTRTHIREPSPTHQHTISHPCLPCFRQCHDTLQNFKVLFTGKLMLYRWGNCIACHGIGDGVLTSYLNPSSCSTMPA
jgi:hypothetical protein